MREEIAMRIGLTESRVQVSQTSISQSTWIVYGPYICRGEPEQQNVISLLDFNYFYTQWVDDGPLCD